MSKFIFTNSVQVSDIPYTLWNNDSTNIVLNLSQDNKTEISKLFHSDQKLSIFVIHSKNGIHFPKNKSSQNTCVSKTTNTNLPLKQDKSKIIGGCLIEPYSMLLLDNFNEVVKKYPHSINLIKSIKIIYPNFTKKHSIDPSKIAHCCGLAIDHNYLCLELATHLIKITIDLLESKGYEWLFIEITNDNYRKIMKKMGGILLCFVNYCKENGNSPIKKYEGCEFYAIPIGKWNKACPKGCGYGPEDMKCVTCGDETDYKYEI